MYCVVSSPLQGGRPRRESDRYGTEIESKISKNSLGRKEKETHRQQVKPQRSVFPVAGMR